MPRIATSVLVFLLLSTGLPATIQAQEPSDEAVALAKLAVGHEVMRQQVAELIRTELGSRSKGDFSVAYLQRRDALWRALEADVAALVSETLSAEQIETATAELQATSAEEWANASQSTESLLAEGRELFNRDTESRRQMAILGCVAGVIVPNIEKALVQTGQPVESFAYDDAFFDKAGPILSGSETMCTCVMDKTLEKYGDTLLENPDELGPETQQFALGLITSGECPNPLADLVAGG